MSTKPRTQILTNIAVDTIDWIIFVPVLGAVALLTVPFVIALELGHRIRASVIALKK